MASINYKEKITKLSQIKEVAEAIGLKCAVTVDPITKGFERANGARVVRLIVGWRFNPIFDPNADPNSSNPVEKNKANPRTADVRIVEVTNGMTAKELIDKYLTKISNSLKTKEPVLDRTISSISKEPQGPSDNELAEALERGVSSVGKNEGGWDDEGEETGEESAFDEISEPSADIDTASDSLVVPTEEKKAEEKSEILKALEIMNKNITTLSDDVGALNNKIGKIDKRVSKVEKTRKQKED